MSAKKYEITGKTFDLKAKIVKAGGKWDPAKKAWIADLYSSDSIWRYEGKLTFTLVNDVDTKQIQDNGYCNLCKSYCFGDCTASQ